MPGGLSATRKLGLADIFNKLKHETLDKRSCLGGLHPSQVVLPLNMESADGEQFHWFADMV